MPKVLILTDLDIKKLITNSQHWIEFPVFKTLSFRLSEIEHRTPVKTCGKCGARIVSSNGSSPAIYREAKNYIISLGEDKRKRLKSLLNADQVKLVVKDDTGTIRQCNF